MRPLGLEDVQGNRRGVVNLRGRVPRSSAASSTLLRMFVSRTSLQVLQTLNGPIKHHQMFFVNTRMRQQQPCLESSTTANLRTAAVASTPDAQTLSRNRQVATNQSTLLQHSTGPGPLTTQLAGLMTQRTVHLVAGVPGHAGVWVRTAAEARYKPCKSQTPGGMIQQVEP